MFATGRADALCDYHDGTDDGSWLAQAVTLNFALVPWILARSTYLLGRRLRPQSGMSIVVDNIKLRRSSV
jgi:hypothetical protein